MQEHEENKTDKGKEIIKYTQSYFAIFSKNNLKTFFGRSYI